MLHALEDEALHAQQYNRDLLIYSGHRENLYWLVQDSSCASAGYVCV